jgi:hypothetical protein
MREFGLRKHFIVVGVAIVIVTVALGLLLFQPKQSPTETPTHASGTIISLDDPAGTGEINEFLPTQTVYAKGEGMEPGDYIIYIVPDVPTWIPGTTTIPTSVATTPVTVGASGTFGPTPIWSPTLTPGNYDIIADHQTLGTQGTYDVHDALDTGEIQVTAGFFVIPEVPLGTIAVLLASFTAVLIKRRRT